MRLLPVVICLWSIPGLCLADWFAESQDKMGTRVEVRLWLEDEARARSLIADAMSEMDRIEARMSTYREDSEISLVNREAAERPVSISGELYALIARSLELGALTGGAFDITYDSVGELYDYREGQRPDRDEVEERLPAVNFENVIMDSEGTTIAFQKEGMRINLGGIAKGYTVERIIAQLSRAGVEHAMVSAGGDTRLLGDSRGRPWMVGIRDPDDEEGMMTRMGLVDEAISTSGDYERFFMVDGERVHHIIDPGSGVSARELRSVTVIGPDATMTDGLSTSVFVMGAAEGMALIESLPDYDAVLVTPDRQLTYSSGLDPR